MIIRTWLLLIGLLLLSPRFLIALSNENLLIKRTVVYSYNKVTGDKYGYRIPALVTAKNGTLLAFAERRIDLSDHAQNDIVLRRSKDNGQTWGKIIVVAEDGKNLLNDPCVVVFESGKILLMYQRFPYGYHARNSGWIKMAHKGYDGPYNTKSLLKYSDDDGIFWSDPLDITHQIRDTDAISVGSPGRGIQLSSESFKGRIIFPLYETIPDGKGGRTWRNRVAYSDDKGITWKLSERIPRDGMKGYGNEAQVVEISDGTIGLF